MLILEEPYVSPLLLKTAEKNSFDILKNNIAEDFSSLYNLKLSDDAAAIANLKSESNPLVYSNSENSINWLFNNLGDSEIVKNIKNFKDKNAFRKILSDIYPDFYFKEFDINELDEIDIDEIPKPFVIKPTVGFLSLGVYTVENGGAWVNVLNSIKEDSKKFADMFPNDVVNSSKFIIEEFIEGDEFAVDAYFSKNGKPVVLNIFNHPFVSKDDVSDRIYVTSKEIIQDNVENFTKILEKIGNSLDIKSFPMHIELRVSNSGKIVPIEVNPMRFAGWCTTDVSFFAYGINNYEYYFNQLEPKWDEVLKDKDGKTYYFAMIETPSDIDKNSIIGFNYQQLQESFSKTLEVRKFDYQNKPLFAIVFGETDNNDEINRILELNSRDFIEFKEESLCK